MLIFKERHLIIQHNLWLAKDSILPIIRWKIHLRLTEVILSRGTLLICFHRMRIKKWLIRLYENQIHTLFFTFWVRNTMFKATFFWRHYSVTWIGCSCLNVISWINTISTITMTTLALITKWEPVQMQQDDYTLLDIIIWTRNGKQSKSSTIHIKKSCMFASP